MIKKIIGFINERKEKIRKEEEDFVIWSYCSEHECLYCKFRTASGDCRIREAFNNK